MTKMISFVRSLCVMAIVSLLAQSVWAATPVAVWEGFKNLTPATGYEIVAGDGVVGSDGVATIAAGKTLKLTKDMGTQFTVVMEVSDIPGAAGSNFATILDAFFSNGAAHLSLDTQEGKLLQKWSHNGTDYGTALKATPISGRNVIVYAYNRNWEKTYINGAEILSGTAGSSVSINRFCIGGYWGDTPTCTANGMKVYRVALYSTALSADEVAEIKCSRSAAAGETYVCSNLDRVETKQAYYTQNVNVDFTLPPTGDYPAGTVVNVTTIKLGLETGTAANSATASITLAGQNGAKGTAETSKTDGYVIQPYTFSPAVEIEIGKTYTFNAGGNKCTGILGFSPIKGNNMAGKDLYCSVEGTVKSIIRKGTISGNCTIATATWANGAPLDGDLVELNVTNDATLTLDSAVNYAYLKITGDGALTISDLTKLGSTPIVGDGTIVIDKNGATIASGRDNGTYDWGITGLTDAAKWTGTVWLKNVVWQNMNPATLGNANSTVRMTGVSGYSYNSNNATAGFAGTLDLVDDGSKLACTINNAFTSTYFFGKLTGTGTFKTTGSHSAQAKYAFKDASAFEGAITIEGNKSVTIGNDIHGAGDYFAGNVIGIRPTGTATVKAGKTWSATTITVNGKLSVENTGAISGTVNGSGTLSFASIPTDTTLLNNLKATAWTGTMELVDYTGATPSGGFNFNNYGHGGSKVKLTNTRLWLARNVTFAPEFVIEGLEVTGTSNGSYIFNKVSGSGELYIHSSNGDSCYFKIIDGSDFAGSIRTERPIFFGSSNDGVASSGNGIVTINVGAEISLASDAVWTCANVLVKGTIKGSGTITNALTFDAGATLDATAGILNVASMPTFGNTVKVKVSATPGIDGIKVLDRTAASEELIATSVTTIVGTEESADYSLYQKQDGIYLMQVSALEWQGENGTAIDAAGNWKGGEYAESVTDGVFKFGAHEGDATVVSVPATAADANTILVEGAYVLRGEGQTYSVHALSIPVTGTLKLENITLKVDTIANAVLSRLTFGTGGQLGLTKVPSWNNTASINVADVSELAAGYYELISWTDKPQSGTTGYGRPTLPTIAGVKDGWQAKFVFQTHRVGLLLRDPEWLARPALTIWPFGDSITEGMSGVNSHANYRVQLYQKLEILGYNVKSVGFSTRTSNVDGAFDASGVDIRAENEWIRHSGVAGALACHYTSNHGMLHDDWQNALDQAGNPDIVLIHIGINDITTNASSGRDDNRWRETFGSVTNIAANILRERPTAKVVMSSMNRLEKGQTYQGNGNANYVKPFRDAMVALMTKVNNGEVAELPQGRVFFADMYDRIRPRSYDNFQEGENEEDGLFEPDHIHPNWEGHHRMSDCWLDQVLAAFPDPKDTAGVFHSRVTPAEVPAVKLGATANVPADYMKGFTKATVITPAADGKERASTVAINKILADNTEITKVGYYVEYVFPSATTNIHRWVWVDMDAIKDGMTVAEAGLPTKTIQQVVSKLHVASNHLAIHPVAATDDSVKGFIEFSPESFGNNGKPVSDGPDHWMGNTSWNDRFAGGVYGSMQMHRMLPGNNPYDAGVTTPAEVLFAYNAWTCNDQKPTEFGIGNFNQHYQGQTLDWVGMRNTSTMHSGCLKSKSIEVWVKVPTVTVEIPTVEHTTSVVTVNGETVDATSGSITVDYGATIAVTYSAAEGYIMTPVETMFTAGEEATIQVPAESDIVKAVAKIGSDYYATLQDAIDDAEDGDCVVVIKPNWVDPEKKGDYYSFSETEFQQWVEAQNYEFEEFKYTGSANITLDLNGVVIARKTPFTNTGSGKITITGNGTIINVTGDIVIEGTTGGDIIVENGTFENEPRYNISSYGYIVVMASYDGTAGRVIINGGTFKGFLYRLEHDPLRGLIVYGGRFIEYLPFWNCAEGYVTRATADGYYEVVPGTYVAEGPLSEYYGDCGDNRYETLQAAVNAAANGATIKLLAAAEISGLEVKGKAIILEHNGKITDVDPLKGTSIGPAINAECTVKLGNWTNAIIIGDFEKCVAMMANKVGEDGNPILNQGAIKDKYPFGSYLSFFIGKNITLQNDVLLPAYAKTAAGVYFCSNTTAENGLVLELNGHEIRQTFADNGNGYTGHPAVNVNSGYLTIQDSSEAGTGKIIGSTYGLGVQDCVSEGVPASHATLKSGIIISQGGAPNGASNYGFVVAAYGHSTFVMDGGTLRADASENGTMFAMVHTAAKANTNEPYATFVMNGGTIESAPASMNAYYSVLASGESTITGGVIRGVSYFYDVTEITGGFVNQIFSAWEISISGTAQIGWIDVIEYEGDDTTIISSGKFAANVVRVYDENYAKIRQDTLLPYVAKGYEVVQGEDEWYYVVPVHPEMEITISGDGTTITPDVSGEGDFIIVDTKTSDDTLTAIPQETGVYQVITRNVEKTPVSTIQLGVINAKEKETVETEKKTIAVAVPFDSATVANLLNTALLSNGDTLQAYITVDGTSGYAKWNLIDGKWVGAEIVGGMPAQPNTTKLARGTAVWVTSAGKVVALGKYDEEDEIVAPTTAETHLLANPTMEAYTPEVKDDETDELVEIGVEKPVRYTKRNGEWTKPGLVEDGGEYIKGPVSGAPTIPVGKGFWFIKK